MILEEQDSNRALEDNFDFQLRLLDWVSKQIHPEEGKAICILDYGSGADASRAGFWQLVGTDETKVVAYDPQIKKPGRLRPYADRVEITNKEPVDHRRFDMVVFNFSLHHMEDPQGVINRVSERLSPENILVVDYNYPKKIMPDEFQRSFATAAEQREVRRQFAGDWEKCKIYHTRFSREEYHEALESAGYQVIGEIMGRGCATYKFALLARRGAK